MTTSEKYVSELCEKSFLPFWSYPNPIGKNNKELCDILIVCGDIIIIISVKDIKMSNHFDDDVNYERWVRKAIDDSVKQIYGAEKYIQSSDEITLKDYSTKIPLSPKDNRKIYRVAIAFRGNPNFPLPMGDFGKGFVSVFDEKSTTIILNELDTIIDFTKYLESKESLHKKATIITSHESDFLAFYLKTGLNLNNFSDLIILDDDLWESYEASDEYNSWKDERAVSYIWDIFIQLLFKDNFKDRINHKKFLEFEEAVRIINLEDRISRILLGISLENAAKEKVQARMLQPRLDKDYTYVFMPLSDKNWEFKKEELLLRCDVARYLNPQIQKVIGVAVGKILIDNREAPIFDICYIDIPEITKDFEAHVKKVQKEFGYFVNPKVSEM
ncbi:hypothetical protein [Chryseobacterium pennae]|uniref:hypothetical protein n=1 Tax=Chryseobacterium pennae TaxID=2258962 RepID=UPI001E4F9D17|nr:hypothetical protein [Chryseobacterium pennae]